jgi:hypothetical protein
VRQRDIKWLKDKRKRKIPLRIGRLIGEVVIEKKERTGSYLFRKS